MNGKRDFSRELETYESLKDGLIEDGNEGSFIIIGIDEDDNDVFLVRIADSYESAMWKGFKKFGLRPFLVKKISKEDGVQNL